MPTYEYDCENGHVFEEFQSIVAAPLELCPICGGRATRRISGGTGLIFKGSGFYLTDYARKNSSPAAESPKPTEKKTETPVKSDAKTQTAESKPAAKGGESGSA
jgi:putative FmdB family regulatory protein